MLARALVGLFGSVWTLKALCFTSHSAVVRRIARLCYSFYQYENCSSIAWNSKFDGEPCFPHGMKSIFISGDAKIGMNCLIFQQVTIGSNSILGSSGLGAPTIGDRCYIGAGAKVIGHITIGSNVRIGANAVVYKDVPDNCVVLSDEQKSLQRDFPLDNRFFSHRDCWSYFDDGRWLPVIDSSVIAELNNGFRK